MRLAWRSATPVATFVAVLVAVTGAVHGDDTATKKDGWIEEQDEQTGSRLMTKELTLYPAAEPLPALKYRLLPGEFDAVEGNAAIYYLKAIGFLERDYARDKLREIWREADAESQETGKEYDQVPPYSWRVTAPSELPLDKVKEYLALTSFQPDLLREASRRRTFDLDRRLREVNDPIGYVLSELQMLRELARMQDLRCRVAIAEDRLDDAILILGQQYALAHHMAQDEFLVSNLVGMACAGVAWNGALYLAQHRDAPNLYWAYAAIPRPLVPTRRSMSTERELLYEQLKVLRDVSETPRPASYWQDFLDRLVPELGFLGPEMGLPHTDVDSETARAVLVGFVAASYPGSRQYLIEQWNLPKEQVEAYPTTQVVFLAMVRFYDQWRDEFFKWMLLPYWQAEAAPRSRRVDEAMNAASEKYGWCSLPTMLLLPAVRAARTAEVRTDQNLAMLQTVEAIRMYGAENAGKLPTSLDELPVPAPVEPFTGKPFDYQSLGDRAILTGHPMPGLRYRLILRFATSSK
jgi:hypothetical protein